MTNGDEDNLYEQAALWHARLQGEDMDWDAFGQWLDADPAHQRAYDEVATIDGEVSDWLGENEMPEAPSLPIPANDVAPSRRSWWMAGAGIAAALVAAVSIPMLTRSPIPASTTYETGASGTKQVALQDGSSVRLDRGTKLAVADGPEPKLTLESGSAYFDVRHDPARSFTVQSGTFTIRDVGTRFAVTKRGAQTSVAVEDGAVEVGRQGGPSIMVKAGYGLDLSGNDANAELRSIDAASVASWRNGRLVYDGTPLTLVAVDISRYAANPVRVDPAIADLRLSGILLIGDGSHLVDQIQGVLPVEARREADHIELVRRGGAARR